MTVTFDAVGPSAAGQTASNPASVTWSHTCSGTDRVLLVSVAVGDNNSNDGNKTISSVTYAGVAMTSLGVRHSNDQSAGYVQVFGLVNPAAGTNSVLVTFAVAPSTAECGSLSFTGADQTTGWGTPVTAAGDGATATAVVTSNTSGNLIAYFVVCGGGTGASPSSPATKRYQANFGFSSAGGCTGAATIPATGSAVSCSWPISSDWWGEVAVEILSAGAGGTTVEGTGTGSFGFSGSAQGVRRTGGTAAGSFGFTGNAAGKVTVAGAAAASFGFAAAALGLRTVRGTAAGGFGFTGTAQGFTGTPPVQGTGTGAFGFTGTATGTPTVVGTATASFGYAGTADGTARVIATAASSFGFTAAATAVRRVVAAAQALFGFTGTAEGGPPPPPFDPVLEPLAETRQQAGTATTRRLDGTASTRESA